MEGDIGIEPISLNFAENILNQDATCAMQAVSPVILATDAGIEPA
jgi:hypothetical protein